MNWDNTALTAQYYKELKNVIKNKILCTELSDTLSVIII